MEETALTKKIILPITLALLFISPFLLRGSAARERMANSVNRLPGLKRQVTVVRDIFGVPHVTASSDHDAYFMMGYLQAEDRFFQMDVARRRGGGALAELFGPGPGDGILASDVMMRSLGAVRAAERSIAAYTPEAVALIQAYADGVNAWLDSKPLPPEYTTLEITHVPRWKPVDSITISKLLSFQLSFDVSDVDNTGTLASYQAAGQLAGFDGAKLFFEDIFSVRPFDAAVTIPPPSGSATFSSEETSLFNVQSRMIENMRRVRETIAPGVIEGARKFVDRYKQIPFLNRAESGIGSNWWVVAGAKTDTRNAMLANDPHLALGTPSTFYEIHLTVDSPSSPMNVYGVSLPGFPGVFLGQNDQISWGATTSTLDLTDFFAERLVIENGAPVATRYRDGNEPLVIIPEVFKINGVQNGVADDITVVSPGDRPSGLSVPPANFIVPRRNNGALIPIGPADAISIQFTGASATRDLEGVFALARAQNLADFKRAIQLLDGASLNWAYADVDGNIATFVGGKVPLREDLQAGTVDGLPPFFLRDGSGASRNEWIPRNNPEPGFNYESLPFEEMPQAVNPAQGFLVNANNDPIGLTLDNNLINQTRGEGIYYISSGFNPGFRAAKITSLLRRELSNKHGDGKVSFHEMTRMQSNVQMFDAEIFTPYILRAFQAARAPGAPAELAALANDPAVSKAVSRLSNWDFSAPTGISKGYDASDLFGIRIPPSNTEVSNSIATTIYTVWRSRILANTIVASLQRVGLGDRLPTGGRMLVDLRFLLDKFPTGQGVGASGLDFFEIPGINAPPNIRRDGLILKSLKDALDLLSGDDFAAAFGGSTNQDDYRWGKLHRITFSHPFGGLVPEFSIPTAGGFDDLSPTLPGLATDGGFETIDIAPFNVMSASSDGYTFSDGPARRYVGELRRGGIISAQIIPGGESGVVNNRFYANQLPLWLTNEYHNVLFTRSGVNCNRSSAVVYNPAN